MTSQAREELRPLILVTNDDGIHSVGLTILVQRLLEVANVFVSAPDREQSAVGHGISLNRPLRAVQLEPGRFAVSGTPADTVLLALYHLCPRRPDLVVSGINLGLNVGTDIHYSGTLAGALEGLIHDVPAIAVSQEVPETDGTAPPRLQGGPVPLSALLDRTARFAARVAAQVLSQKERPVIALNINAPAVEGEAFRWTRQGRRAYQEHVDERHDPRGIPYYWIGGPPVPGAADPGTDGHAVEGGLIAMTPLNLDLTAEVPSLYRSLLGELQEESAAQPAPRPVPMVEDADQDAEQDGMAADRKLQRKKASHGV